MKKLPASCLELFGFILQWKSCGCSDLGGPGWGRWRRTRAAEPHGLKLMQGQTLNLYPSSLDNIPPLEGARAKDSEDENRELWSS